MKTILSWALIVFTLCVMLFTVITLRTVDARDRNLFGYRMMIVQSDSMAATDFEAGDLIFVKEVDPATLKEGDIIAFFSRNSHNFGETVTHKIRSVTEDEHGWTIFITYGTSTDADDEMPVHFSDVQGIYVGRIKNLGLFFAFLRTPKGYISFIMIPMLIMIFASLFNAIRMFSGAQKQAEEERLAMVEEERRKMAQLQREMAELRAMIQALLTKAASDPESVSAVARQMQLKSSQAKKPQPPEMPANPVKEPMAPSKPAPRPSTSPAEKPQAPKTPAKQVPPAPNRKTEVIKPADSKEIAAPENKKVGRYAAAPERKKASIPPQHKPNVTPKMPAGDRELDVEAIMAEFRSEEA